MILNKESQVLLKTERAAHDLRKGFPVIIKTSNSIKLIVSPETASNEIISTIYSITKEPPHIVLTANRLNFLLNKKNYNQVHALPLNKNTIKDIASICGLTQNNLQIKEDELIKAPQIDKTSLKLAKIAELIPSIITFEIPTSFEDDDILSISQTDIENYKETSSYQIQESCRTNLALKHSIDSEIIAYRPNIGGKEHYAIIIGKPSKTPLIRIHSSCYTGDLLESLACDCHDQLHCAIELMSKKGGGIILYMLQEGRGIGLINKLRAYALKEKGFDTVDANEALGFDDDERLFLPAAEILKRMGIKKVELLTNNPKKASGLENCGIKVTACVPHVMQANEHNENYLKTKANRLGHDM